MLRAGGSVSSETTAGLIASRLAEAQAALDAWVHEYNDTREHQSLGNRPPAERFATAQPAVPEEPDGPTPSTATKLVAAPRLIRRVLVDGKVSLLNFKYYVGRYLAGQSVELVCHDGLVEVFHFGTLVATHTRRHLLEQEEHVLRQALAAAPVRPSTDRGGPKVDHSGSVSFSGAGYRVGNAYRGRQVEVSLAGDTCRSGVTGGLLRTHEPSMTGEQEHGSLANPEAGRSGPMPPSTIPVMSRTYRSHSVARLPNFHTTSPMAISLRSRRTCAIEAPGPSIGSWSRSEMAEQIVPAAIGKPDNVLRLDVVWRKCNSCFGPTVKPTLLNAPCSTSAR